MKKINIFGGFLTVKRNDSWGKYSAELKWRSNIRTTSYIFGASHASPAVNACGDSRKVLEFFATEAELDAEIEKTIAQIQKLLKEANTGTDAKREYDYEL